MKLLICVPTYNEAENIAPFLNAVFENAPPDAGVLVIDDNSPDGTAAIVESIIPQYQGRLHILKRPGKQGLASAYLAAFEWGLAKDRDVFLEMDADFSHDPRYIPDMLAAIQNHDIVIGSRGVPGGGVEGWPPLRNFISKGGSRYARTVLGCPIKDLTGGFTLWTKNALLQTRLDTVLSKGYLFQVEMKYRAWCAGCRIKEIPIIFTDRKFGTSKMSKKIFFEALLNVWKIKWNAGVTGRSRTAGQFIKFGVTGALGAITNLALFFVLADKAALPEIPVSIACFILAGTQNYIINHTWSFANNTEKSASSVKQWLLFLGASLAGLILNIMVMKLIIMNCNLPYKFIAQAAGIAAGMAVNFIFSKSIVFRSTQC